ncbi:olfactory receptor 52E8-like [Leptodactylus fuscus]|uniref:olfactory receptor 52E8-like n=1 Tax=Leptodactylus fuscus TaxID=238119 RepID=UPI003F4E7F7B
MINSTHSNPSHMSLAFGDLSNISYLYGVITFLGFLVIVTCNYMVISTIVLHKSLHEPMYVFICALCTNDMFGSSTFYPSLFVNLISKTQSISYGACIIQDFCINTYASCEFTILAVMALDRYVCICNPLRYPNIMTLGTAYKLVAAACIYSLTMITVLVILTVRLPLCDNVIPKIYCDNWTVVRLSCVDTMVNNVYGMIATTMISIGMPLLTLISYIEILKVCAKSKEARAKAIQTCTPQITSLLIFFTNVVFEVMLYRFIHTIVPHALRVVMSIQPFIVPPIVNPILYGLKTKAIKEKIQQRLDRWRGLCVLLKRKKEEVVSCRFSPVQIIFSEALWPAGLLCQSCREKRAQMAVGIASTEVADKLQARLDRLERDIDSGATGTSSWRPWGNYVSLRIS